MKKLLQFLLLFCFVGLSYAAKSQLAGQECFPKRNADKLVFDEASLCIDFFEPSLTIKTTTKSETKKFQDFDRNQLFLDQLAAFMKQTTTFQATDSLRHLSESQKIISICHG